ncbi:MAG: formate dehydrogenase accessory protein FdhE [Deltaproteobacteria bacterium HGW-Deltaproteobacteria-12]|nr:MAG: formate dehydrogenase accessory protein FdhE [Deltaproteobacteria bacterium HGW-Deltaproteobacteria-12]
MSSKLRKSLQTIEDYKTEHPHYNEILDILGEILIVREEYRNSMKDSIFSVDENIIAQKMAGGLPLIDMTRGNFDLTRPREYFNSLIAIAERKMPEDATSIVDIIRNQQFDWEKMIIASFDHVEEEPVSEGRQKHDDAEDSLDLIDLFVEESLRPELEYVAEKYSPSVAKFGWAEGYCPICGKEPKIGEIRGEEDGKRYLFCHQCGYKWNFRRIKCPFCGNEEQHSLAYFAVEGEERYHVDVCNKCRRYIKTVELSKAAGEINLDVEDIATLHLDMLAYEEGYN